MAAIKGINNPATRALRGQTWNVRKAKGQTWATSKPGNNKETNGVNLDSKVASPVSKVEEALRVETGPAHLIWTRISPATRTWIWIGIKTEEDLHGLPTDLRTQTWVTGECDCTINVVKKSSGLNGFEDFFCGMIDRCAGENDDGKFADET